MYRNKGSIYPYHYGYPGQMLQNIPGDYQKAAPFSGRSQPYPYPYPGAQQNSNWYQQPNPYLQQQYVANYQAGPGAQNFALQYQYPQKDSQFLFHNPLQPQDDYGVKQNYVPMNGYQMMNPYPKQNVIQKQPGGMNSLINSFKSQDGSVDFNKMVSTAGQMMNAVNQVSSLVKGFGGIFKV